MHAATAGLKGSLKRSSLWFASRFGRHRFGSSEPALWVMMYHRILPPDDARFVVEEPGMIVTPQTFRQHLRELKKLFTVLPLSEWIELRRRGASLPARACAITFDDGWLDNYEHALPALVEEQVPATVFAVSSMIGTTRKFWPNRVAQLLALDSDALSRADLSWLHRVAPNVLSDPHSRERTAQIIRACKSLGDDEIHRNLDRCEQQLKLPRSGKAEMMSWDQLREMQRSGLVDIGSHTCNHYRLVSSLPAETMEQEIVASKKALEAELNRPVNLFCYPNGDASPRAVELVRQHYTAAVTTRRGINIAATSPHELMRIGVHEDISRDAVSFGARLSGWF